MPDGSVWRDEAVRKGFPEKFVERLAASESVSEEEKGKIVGSLRTVADIEEVGGGLSLREWQLLREDPGVMRTANKTREEWIDYGRSLGEDEARSRRESPEDTAQRVARAKAYAAWEWDGKPVGHGEHYRAEFGIRDPKLLSSFLRPPQEASS